VTWYDRAELYDTVFSWDPAAEREFVLGASARWGIAEPRRTLEPFCGPGRMLRAMPGRVVGFDCNRAMLRRAARRGSAVFRADAARFGVREGSFDLAFSLIDSFRHLKTEEEARGHLRCVARALRPGGVYVLGFDVTGDAPGGAWTDEWDTDGWHVCVRVLGDADPSTRLETMHVRIEGHGEAVEDFDTLRTYTRRQVEDLIDGEGSFELAAAFTGRGYRVDEPVELSEVEVSAQVVLRR
jgi:SAM-dependent methyltransferase